MRARLAQQGNSSSGRPHHNILASLFSVVPPPERGGAVEIMVLKFGHVGRVPGSLQEVRAAQLGLACACACLPSLFAKALHDTTKLKNAALFLCLSPISTMSILTRKGKGRSGFVPSPHHHPYCRQTRQAGRLPSWLRRSLAPPVWALPLLTLLSVP